MRSTDQIQAVQRAAVALEERAAAGTRDEAYAAGVGDTLAWLQGQCSPRVFRGFSEAMEALTDAGEADTAVQIAADRMLATEPEWVPLEEVTGDFYELMIDVNLDAPISSGPLTVADTHHLAQLVGYAWASEVRGEPLGEPQVHAASDARVFGFTVYADSTKSRSDDIGMAVDRFLAALHTVVAEGTPVRKSDRAGAGTKGTRLVEGFRAPVTLRVYAR